MSAITTTAPVEQRVRYKTAAEWWNSLGQVPMERILFDPPPGMATEADVVRLDDHEDRICELVGGTLVEKVMGSWGSMIAAKILSRLMQFVEPRKLGVVLGADGLLRILPQRVRIPDVAFIAIEKFPGGVVPRQPILGLAPDLAVEVLSDSNTRKEMSIKLHEYFTAGTRLVWYVDPETRMVDVHTSERDVRRYAEGQTLGGEPVLSGFSLEIAQIFQMP